MVNKCTFIIFMLLVSLFYVSVFSQEYKKNFEKGVELLKKGSYSEALDKFEKSIKLKPNRNESYHNAASCLIEMKRFDEADKYLDKAINDNPKNFRSYVLKAVIKRSLTKYVESLKQLYWVLDRDVYNMEAYYNKGIVYALFNNYDSACSNFGAAKFALAAAGDFYKKHCSIDSVKKFKDTNNILYLKVKSEDEGYGFTSSKPIKVGTGVFGGLMNENIYFSLLRGHGGSPITYERVGRCCPFTVEKDRSTGYVDKFEITFIDSDGKEKIETIFITYSQFEEPMILKGFETVESK